MQIADQLFAYIWSHTNINNCNTYVLNGNPPLMVDPGHAQVYGHVEMGLNSDGITQAPGLVVLTHCHPDHMESAQALQRQGWRVAMHPLEVEYMEGEGRQLAAAMGMSYPELVVDILLEEGELKVGENSLSVLATPGHSPGHICLYHPGLKALFAGDLIFAQGVGRVDFPGGSGEDLKASIERVAGLDIELVLTGHGPIVKGAEQVQANFALIKKFYFGML